jgi:hypothetical protein
MSRDEEEAELDRLPLPMGSNEPQQRDYRSLFDK